MKRKIWVVVCKLASGAALYHIWHHRNAIFSIAKGKNWGYYAVLRERERELKLMAETRHKPFVVVCVFWSCTILISACSCDCFCLCSTNSISTNYYGILKNYPFFSYNYSLFFLFLPSRIKFANFNSLFHYFSFSDFNSMQVCKSWSKINIWAEEVSVWNFSIWIKEPNARKEKRKRKRTLYMLGLLEKKKNNNYITITNLNIGKMNINMYICIFFFFILKAAGHILHFAK